jgi:hypothetical protein
MEEKKEIILPSKRYANADEQELSIKLNLETSESLLRVGERDIILDIAKLYDDERNKSVNYKIFGKMNMIFRNMYSGNTEYDYLKQRLYLVGDGSNNDFTGFIPYDEFAFLRRDLYREVTVIPTGNTLGNDIYTTTGVTINTLGSTGHTTITAMNAPYQNWNIYLSYAYTGDTQYPMKYSLSGGTTFEFTAGNGIPFRVTNNTKTFTLTSPVPHGLKDGDYVVINNKPYYVNSTGNEIFDSENYVIVLNKSQFTTDDADTLIESLIVTGKRCLDRNNVAGSTSTYYVRKHKTLSDTGDYILDNVGFENPIFEHERKIILENSNGDNDILVERNRPESVLFDFKEPLTLSGIKNNLGFTPTEVFVTTIFRNGNGYFDYPPKVGYKFNFHDSWIDEHFDGDISKETNLSGRTFTKSGYTFTSGVELPIGSELVGDFVEYNKKELKERVISGTFHKIYNPTELFDYGQTDDTIYSGATETNPIGLYYQAHHRVKLRELSPYLETAKTNQIYNLPENTVYDSDENVWRWRDLYTHGYIDPDGIGTNFPYVNNIHYIKNEINLYLRNERYYTNKQNGVASFNSRTNTNNLIC